jgi:two-component system catabolic regulation response regulator CreB
VGSILLVEADAELSERWSAAMGAAGHAVLTAASARDALATIREGGIDVVVIDAHDPAAGIVDFARGCEALPDAPPILLVSSSPDAPDLSVRIGAAVFLAKPVEPEELTAAVDRLLERMLPVRVVEDEPTGPTRQYG